jgi:6-phosphogluconate dehydrogenase
MAAYSEGLNILRHANVGKNSRTADAETTPLRNPEFYQYDFNLAGVYKISADFGASHYWGRRCT